MICIIIIIIIIIIISLLFNKKENEMILKANLEHEYFLICSGTTSNHFSIWKPNSGVRCRFWWFLAKTLLFGAENVQEGSPSLVFIDSAKTLSVWCIYVEHEVFFSSHVFYQVFFWILFSSKLE